MIEPKVVLQEQAIAVSTQLVGRIASCSFDDLLSLGASRSSALVLAFEHARAELDEASKRLCALLFEAVPRSEPAARRLLINLQRDVFRLKRIDGSALGQVVAAAGGDSSALDAYARATAACDALDREAEAVFAEELEQIRAAFRELMTGEVMQDGLALSSAQLLDSLTRFYLVRRELNGKDLDTEIGAAKYFSRASAKTSPFSKFTALTAATLTDGGPPIHVGRPDLSLTSHVRLNARILRVLCDVLAQDRDVRLRLPLRLNSTLALTGGTYRFLTSWNNMEAFQQVSAHAVVDFLLERLRGGPATWNDLQSALVDAFECDAEEAAAMIGKLLSIGLVETDLAVSGSDPDWDLRLRDLIRTRLSDVPVAARLESALADARASADAFGQAHGTARIAIRRQLHESLSAAAEAFISNDGADTMPATAPAPAPAEADAGKMFEHRPVRRFPLPAENLVYEDATVDLQMQLRRDGVEALARSANRLIDAFASFDPSLDGLENLASFVTATYGRDAEIPLLSLYEDFYRSRKAEGETSLACVRTEQRVARNKELLARLRSVIGERAGSRGEPLFLTAADLDAAGLPDGPAEDRPSSCGAFMQLYRETRGGQEVLCGVLNGLGPGFGKLPNRFLHILPSAMTEETRERNSEIAGEAIFAEAIDGSYFNANLHPPLMPFEISVPGGQTSLPASEQIAVSDLVVRLGEAGLPRLVHLPTRKTVFAFDCGLQRVTTRSKLYQLLSLFSLSGQPTVQPLIGLVNAMTAKPGPIPSVRAWPRIVFEDRLVVQRRAWTILAPELPRRERNEPALHHFRRVDGWRRGIGIPRHVFAQIVADSAKPVKPDDRKPQFLGFDNPLLVSVFEKMAGKAATGVNFAEMLPANDQLLTIDDKRYVTEHVLQWYRGGAVR